MFRRENLSLLAAVSAVLIPLLLVGVSLARDGGISFVDHDSGEDAFMGVVLEEETDYPEGGARITKVIDDSAADDAGLKKGDIIVAFDGQTVRGPVGLSNKIDDLEPGDEVEITIIRGGREQTVDLELGEHAGYQVFGWNRDGASVLGKAFSVFDCDDDDDDCPFSFNCSGDDCDGITFDFGSIGRSGPMLGVQIALVTRELREHLGSDGETGILVSRVVSGSPAEDGGINVGDLIVAVDGQDIEDVGDIRNTLEDAWGETIDVEVIRDGRSRNISVALPDADDDRRSGPRAHYFRFGDDDGTAMGLAQDALREAQGRVRDAMIHARAARVDAMSQARGAKRSAMSQAREAWQTALAVSRESSREARSAARDALRTHRSTIL